MPRLPHTSKQAAQLFAAMLERADAWQHGYALMQQTGLASGSLYPLLIRLADDGYLDLRWQEQDSGPARREYRLTPAGRSLAHERLARFAARTGVSLTGAKP